MNTYCGEDCGKCGFRKKCKGCKATCGNPFGGGCLAADYIRTGGTEAIRKLLLTAADKGENK